ncbi:phage late control D family protein [Loktanella sp. 3ANDIMAR09]|uniref:phage late control D family protein n=1 Tax=Loktanella sp. 3ANDIMAR09 TaxID=1225657 RepID=UPI00155E6040|nr:contractile injection system protein, VgrG/Pvc8 family [Loktanella sp. 3ANDIMAR09]
MFALPGKLRLTATAADLTGKVKNHVQRNWDNASISQIVGDIATDLGLESKVAPEIGGFLYSWIGMIGESPMHFLERLAGRHGALFSIKGRTLVFAIRGAGIAPGGAPLTPTVIGPGDIVPGSLMFRTSSRGSYGKVVASYMDRSGAARKDVSFEIDPENASVFRIDQPLASEGEAYRAARSKADELRRSLLEVRCTIVGRPTARAGAPIVFAGCRVGMDGREFILSGAEHRFGKDGYTTDLTGTVKPVALAAQDEVTTI